MPCMFSPVAGRCCLRPHVLFTCENSGRDRLNVARVWREPPGRLRLMGRGSMLQLNRMRSLVPQRMDSACQVAVEGQ